MKNIGQRIKELRKKNDLTQEKLADFLGVTFQSVSKWECGATMPDLALIVPLSRVLHVSTDELLGVKPAEQDERKAYFDSEYFQFWKKDHEEDLKTARQAVAEYPGDFRYLYWLASNEWYVGYSMKYCGTDTETELLDSSRRHYEMVLENCEDTEIRNHAIFGLMHVYKSMRCYDEAKKYAEMYPEEPESCRDEMLLQCLRGAELDMQCKKILRKALLKLCNSLSYLRAFTDKPCEEALIAEEAVVKAIITDGNYQHFHITLSLIYMERAKIAMHNGSLDEAATALSVAKNHAVSFDEMNKTGIAQYTCPLLSGYTIDHRDDRKDDWSLTEDVKRCADENIFAPLRDRDDFKELFE